MSPILFFFFPVVMVLIICLFLAWYFLHKARHNERILLIEKGLEPLPKIERQGGSPLLKIGIVLIGLSIGLLIDNTAGRLGWNWGDGFSMAVMGICGGISLIIANKVGNTDGK